MADTMVERLTGQASAIDVPVEINLVLTDSTLSGESDEPAEVLEYGPIPAESARSLVSGPGDHVPMWRRRVYRDPNTDQLVAMDARRRLFSASQRRFIQMRDQRCRTPWCEAPIRHIDHVIPFADGCATTVENAQGYCQACNHAKQVAGWRTIPTGRAGEGLDHHADPTSIYAPTTRPSASGPKRAVVRRRAPPHRRALRAAA